MTNRFLGLHLKLIPKGIPGRVPCDAIHGLVQGSFTGLSRLDLPCPPALTNTSCLPCASTHLPNSPYSDSVTWVALASFPPRAAAFKQVTPSQSHHHRPSSLKFFFSYFALSMMQSPRKGNSFTRRNRKKIFKGKKKIAEPLGSTEPVPIISPSFPSLVRV